MLNLNHEESLKEGSLYKNRHSNSYYSLGNVFIEVFTLLTDLHPLFHYPGLVHAE